MFSTKKKIEKSILHPISTRFFLFKYISQMNNMKVHPRVHIQRVSCAFHRCKSVYLPRISFKFYFPGSHLNVCRTGFIGKHRRIGKTLNIIKITF